MSTQRSTQYGFCALGNIFAHSLKSLWDFPRALRLRQPLDKLALRRYDILAAKRVITREEFDNPPDEFWRNLAVKAKRWPNRLREAPFWSKKKSLGRGDVPTHEHELQ